MSARANAVLPAPRSPDSVTRSPGSSAQPISAAKRAVARSSGRVRVKLAPPVEVRSIADAFRSIRVWRRASPEQASASPVTFSSIPSVEKVSETIVAKPGHLARDRQTQQASEPRIARRAPPDLDCTIGADEEPSFGVQPIEPAPDVLDSGTEGSERRGLQIDVAKLDCAVLRRAHKPSPLPRDAAITDGAFGVVPNDELGKHDVLSSEHGADQRSNIRDLNSGSSPHIVMLMRGTGRRKDYAALRATAPSPVGNVQVTVVPSPTTDAMPTVPPASSTHERSSERPMPGPRGGEPSECVSNQLQTRSSPSGGMPGPLSVTENATASARRSATSVMVAPPGEKLTALARRLNRICFSRFASATQVPMSDGVWMSSVNWALISRSRTPSAAAIMASRMSTGPRLSCMRPASMVARSRMLLISAKSVFDDTVM